MGTTLGTTVVAKNNFSNSVTRIAQRESERAAQISRSHNCGSWRAWHVGSIASRPHSAKHGRLLYFSHGQEQVVSNKVVRQKSVTGALLTTDIQGSGFHGVQRPSSGTGRSNRASRC